MRDMLKVNCFTQTCDRRCQANYLLSFYTLNQDPPILHLCSTIKQNNNRFKLRRWVGDRPAHFKSLILAKILRRAISSLRERDHHQRYDDESVSLSVSFVIYFWWHFDVFDSLPDRIVTSKNGHFVVDGNKEPIWVSVLNKFGQIVHFVIRRLKERERDF